MFNNILIQLDNFVSFGRSSSGKVLILTMTEFVVLFLMTKYQVVIDYTKLNWHS